MGSTNWTECAQKIKKGMKFGGSVLETVKRSVGWEKIMV